MKVAVIGGGINGVMTAWAFARRGDSVDLFEKGRLMSATSHSSSKMLHGGLRYLEHGHLRLVREALQERSWWIRQAPEFARPLELLIPIYRNGERAKWLVGAGIRLYDLLAIGSGFPRGRWYSADEVVERFPGLKRDELLGAYGYWDARMDDYRLGLWAAERAGESGARLHEFTAVLKVHPATGEVALDGSSARYDRIVNVAGPWAETLLARSGVASAYRLDLIRGSHIVVPGKLEHGCVLQVPGEKRILFVLPHGENTLLGTTEVSQADPDHCLPSDEEIDYLTTNYNRCFFEVVARQDIISSFAGIRPIVASKTDFSAASRESVIERQGRLINVFGGKWTTSRALAEAVVTKSQY
ncbi:FAD-dependent oxidoreductase [Accumulibacter sp.]|jgi:glycerol-3-phosphate dehydrogenase|uniref:FAD dependent oxidoreductase n=1 Tax=Accumulibacter regalis TaxID=522306 RepID=C7RIV4_ACCRE|nr:FAD-dependent oxidoreductase [Accumulibacter sp.]MBN8496283.1 FAD-dependent oxidoreductase [Accumulibacter sp.]MBO3713486.1 FAD-dependent oxidoreductase [Accumulibacter sp.]